MRVAVFVEHGRVLSAVADHDIQVAVVDYDVDKTEAPDRTPDGEPCEIEFFDGDRRAVDADYVTGLFGSPTTKHPLRIRFGRPETGVPVDDLEFDTEAELVAYLRGVDDAQGWDDYEIFEDEAAG